MAYCLGIDLGGTHMAAALVDPENGFSLSHRVTRPTVVTGNPDDLVQQIVELGKACLADAGIKAEELDSMGIGSPGVANSETGSIDNAHNLGVDFLPLTKALEKAFGVPVGLVNDANAAACGEFLAGAGAGCRSLVAVTLGTGVGGGIILDGKLLTGRNYAAGEIGHMVLIQDGEPCTCGQKGCLEAYASATALIRQTRRAMEAHPESAMWKLCPTLDQVNGILAFDAAREGDPAGKEVLDNYIRHLAWGVISLINLLDPEVVCIGGGISGSGDELLLPLREQVYPHVFAQNATHPTRVELAKLGNHAGLIGAACIRWMEHSVKG